MIYLTNRLFRAVLILLAVVPITVGAENNDELYASGKAAYEERNYVDALKYLYAYSKINQLKLEEHPEFAETLQSIISECEAILRLAIASNRSATIDPKTGNLIFRVEELDAGFSGTGKDINDLLKSGSGELERIQQFNQQQSAPR